MTAASTTTPITADLLRGAVELEETYRGLLPDALHPDHRTHRLMGERFAALAFGSGGPLTRG